MVGRWGTITYKKGILYTPTYYLERLSYAGVYLITLVTHDRSSIKGSNDRLEVNVASDDTLPYSLC